MTRSTIAGPADAAVKSGSADALWTLRSFARTRPVAERCDLCGAELGPLHRHLLYRDSRQVVCSCDACAVLFCGQQGAKFLRIPRRIVRLEGFCFTEEQWDATMLPINLAFFLRKTSGKTEAMYPSPAGIMQSLIDLPGWASLFSGEGELSTVEPEVEALLVNRMGGCAACYIVPIDACYRLAGLIRTKWRGISGGAEVWKAATDFFAELEQHAKHPESPKHA